MLMVKNKRGKIIISLIALVLLVIILAVLVFINVDKKSNINGLQKSIQSMFSLDDNEITSDSITTLGLSTTTFNSIEDVVWPELNQNGNIKDDFAIVSDAKITGITDGTAPWDSNNEAGNDSSKENGIVRSFDSITYNLGVSLTANVDQHPDLVGEKLNGGYVLISATLAEGDYYWDIDSMHWATTMWGQVSKDKKTLVAIIKRDSETDLNSATIKDLPLCVKVLGEKNGTEIPLPEVKAWMNGNDDSEKKTATTDKANKGKITVSAAQKYNVFIHSTDGDSGKKVYLNFNTGKASTSDDENAKLGRLYGMSVEIDLKNTLTEGEANKGIKGIEMPTGEIAVDLDCYLTKNGVKTDTKPILWNYSINWATSGEIEGRQFKFGSDNTLRDRFAPIGKIIYTSNPLNAAYDSGDVSMTQENPGDIIKVAFTNYRISGIFPTYINSTPADRLKDVGCIAVAFLQVFCPEPTETGEYYFNTSEGNGSEDGTTVSKISVNNNEIEQQTNSDDFFKRSYNIGINGIYGHYINLLKGSNQKNLASELGSRRCKSNKKSNYLCYF